MHRDMSIKELRDYFAAEALNGLLAGRTMTPVTTASEKLVKDAFDLANAMCEESKLRSLLDSDEGSEGTRGSSQ